MKKKLAAEPLLLTPEAQAAVNRSKLSRRDFVKTAGFLMVGFSLFRSSRLSGAESTAAQEIGVPGDQLDSWIAIGADGHVTAYTGQV